MDRLVNAFQYIDRHTAVDVIAEAEIELASGEALTVRAGGRKATWSRAGDGVTAYEVLIDADPPRFWQRFEDKNGLTYSQVPRLLVTHHITRRGGIAELTLNHIEIAPVTAWQPRTISSLEELYEVLGTMISAQQHPSALSHT